MLCVNGFIWFHVKSSQLEAQLEALFFSLDAKLCFKHKSESTEHSWSRLEKPSIFMKQQVGRNIVEQQIGDCRHHVQDLQPARTHHTGMGPVQFANGQWLTL